MNIFQTSFQTIINFFSNIKSYSGDYKNDLYHGKGRLEFKDGSVYEGQFENNKMDGYGKIFFKDGSQQRLIYKKGKFKDVYTEDYKIHWKNTVEGTFQIRAADCTKAMDIFKSLTKQELLQKSQLNADIKKMKVTDRSVFVEEEQFN